MNKPFRLLFVSGFVMAMPVPADTSCTKYFSGDRKRNSSDSHRFPLYAVGVATWAFSSNDSVKYVAFSENRAFQWRRLPEKQIVVADIIVLYK